jgi:hypothetical protein
MPAQQGDRMTLGSHQTTVGRSQSHITPLSIVMALGEFGPCAKTSYTERDDGLSKPWRGRVWLNPPFDRYRVAEWIRRLADHGRGTALLHARTEAAWFEPCWRSASGILFMSRRICFYKPDGSKHPHNSGAPPLLVAFGREELSHLQTSGIPGALVTAWDATI